MLRVKEILKSKGMTAKELAGLLGISDCKLLTKSPPRWACRWLSCLRLRRKTPQLSPALIVARPSRCRLRNKNLNAWGYFVIVHPLC